MLQVHYYHNSDGKSHADTVILKSGETIFDTASAKDVNVDMVQSNFREIILFLFLFLTWINQDNIMPGQNKQMNKMIFISNLLFLDFPDS